MKAIARRKKENLLRSLVYSVIVSFTLLGPLQTWANNNENNRSTSITQAQNEPAKVDFENLVAFAKQVAQQGNPQYLQTLSVIDSFVFLEIINRKDSGKWKKVLYREKEISQILDTLVREKNKVPIVIGDIGVGKTAVLEQTAYDIYYHIYPDGIYEKELSNKVIFKVSSSFLSRLVDFDPPPQLAKAFYKFVDSLETLTQQATGKDPILFITEAQNLHPVVLEELRKFVEKSSSPISFVLEANSKGFGNTIAQNQSFMKIAKTVLVEEPKPEEIKDIVLENWVNTYKERYNVQLTEDVVQAAIELAADYRHDLAEPSRTIYFLEDFSIYEHRLHKGSSVTPDKKELFSFVAKQSGVPVIPQDEENFHEYMETLKAKIKKEVLHQDTIVDGLVDQFAEALSSQTRHHSIALITGPTGVGKTYSAEVLAELFYGSKSRILEIDMTQFRHELDGNVLFGASNGVLSSDKEKGIVNEFLDGRGRGGGIIILNEFEEAHASIITRFMELFDKGEIRGGDGRVRKLGRSLIVITTNKGTNRILSYEAIRGMTPEELEFRLKSITDKEIKAAFTEKESYSQDNKSIVKEAIPERIDRFYFASPILKDWAIEIAEINVKNFIKAYEKMGRGHLEVGKGFALTITSAAYDEAFGVRQVKKMIHQSLEKAIKSFKRKYGYHIQDTLYITAKPHPSHKTASFIIIKNKRTGETLEIQGPSVPVSNRLLDHDFRFRLAHLKENLESEIFGQPEAINAIVNTAQAQFLNPEETSVSSVFLLGSTGNGKSELGKVTAKYLYGRENAVAVFEMGNVKNEHDMHNIFSPPKGIVGSDNPGELESFLINNPHGGVLIFDEMSNAGGNDPRIKNAIAKMFYNMLEEGKWTTPSGKTYDMTKYLFIFTGNDGEELFRGYSSDEVLNQIYKEVASNPSKGREILREAGFPEAFLGRVSSIVIMRPILSNIRTLIAHKFLHKWSESVSEAQPFRITYDENFEKNVGELLYSPAMGARSIKGFIKGSLSRIVADSVFHFNWDELIESGRKGEVHLEIITQKPSLPFYKGKFPDTKKAILKVTLKDKGRVLFEEKLDFTKEAHFMPQIPYERAVETAYHEMGHAVGNIPHRTGKKVTKITIVPEKLGETQSLGYTLYGDSHKDNIIPNREFLVYYIASLLGGSEAEKRLGVDINTGRANDLDTVGKIIRKLAIEGNLIPELDGTKAFLNKEGDPLEYLPADKAKILNQFVTEIIADARAKINEILDKNWHVVEAGAQLLMEYGTLDEKDFSLLFAEGEKVKKLRKLYKAGILRDREQKDLKINLDVIRKRKGSPPERCAEALKP